MKTLAILSRKGGTGKTTLATNLAVAAVMAGHTTVLLDLDPQSSAAKWGDRREQESPTVISTHAEPYSAYTGCRGGKRGNACNFGYCTAYRSVRIGRSTRSTDGACPVQTGTD